MPVQKIRVAQLQMKSIPGDIDANLEMAGELIKRACRKNIQLAILPELFTTCCDYDKITSLTPADTPKTLLPLREIAKEYSIFIIAGSIAERHKGDLFNTTYVISDKGSIVARYSKIYLIKLMDENKFFTPGSQIVSFSMHEIKIGLAICYDLRFPEIFRILTLKHKTVIISVSAGWYKVRGKIWVDLLNACAIENQLFMIGTNKVGADKIAVYAGHSLIANPLGEIISSAGTREETIITDLDLSLIRQNRNYIPAIKDHIRVQKRGLYNH